MVVRVSSVVVVVVVAVVVVVLLLLLVVVVVVVVRNLKSAMQALQAPPFADMCTFLALRALGSEASPAQRPRVEGSGFFGLRDLGQKGFSPLGFRDQRMSPGYGVWGGSAFWGPSGYYRGLNN